jgi:methyltransferase (TIGR00027 family)
MSQTAEMAAIARAIHQEMPPAQRVLDDPIASRLVNMQGAAAQAVRAMRKTIPPDLLPRLTNFVLRSRFSEDSLQAAVRAGVRQFVIVGAGLDTFAYRQPGWAAGLHIFEVDNPAAQTAKRQSLSQAGIAEPPNVKYVPLDLEGESMLQALARSGFDASAPAFFSMLGVSQYLELEKLESLLASFASLPRRSSFVLTIIVPNDKMPPDEAAIASLFAQQSAQFGEPWRTRLDPVLFCENLKRKGFSDVEYLSPSEANTRYFADRTDLRAPSMEQMIKVAL